MACRFFFSFSLESKSTSSRLSLSTIESDGPTLFLYYSLTHSFIFIHDHLHRHPYLLESANQHEYPSSWIPSINISERWMLLVLEYKGEAHISFIPTRRPTLHSSARQQRPPSFPAGSMPRASVSHGAALGIL